MTAPGSRVDSSTLGDDDVRRLRAALEATVRGEVEFGAGTRAAYATDSSNYRQVPIGVVFPRDTADVVAAVRACAEHDAPVLARGAGTSLAGQACNVAVVLDLSRHMTQILDLDPVARTARVQPGVVLDDLRRAAELHGLTFGPDPATHAWCTLGGMVGNNSCGTHALHAGKTVDNVEALQVVTYAGDVLQVASYDEKAYAAAVLGQPTLAPVLGGLKEIVRRYESLIEERYVDIPRRVSGYNLDDLLPRNGFHIARALVGTESTCVVVTEITVRLIESPAHRRLVVLGYPDIYAAADAVPGLLEDNEDLLGLEGFDRTLTDQMRTRGLNVAHLELLPPGGGWLLAEVGSNDEVEADARAAQLTESLPAHVDIRRYDDAMDQRRVWLIRESGLGATAIRADGTHNLEGWEDAAVAPERLGDYLREINLLWKEFGYSGAWYGHFGQGCVHTRNDFDLHTPQGLADYRAYVERAADLVVSMGGSLSGEHGDGQSRGELLERMYGPELVDAFRQFKAVFDPRGRMNPGKVVDAYPLDTNLRFGPDYPKGRHHSTFFALLDDGGSLQNAAERCVGVGRCRRDDAGTMCPSYRATRDERHSTRGRAKLLVEMFQGEVTTGDWRSVDVREALELCLSCKGCVTDCPTHVDMATYKAEFLAHHYARRLRPRAMYALGLVAEAARVATRFPRIANAATGSAIVRQAAGVTTARPAPAYADRSWRRRRPPQPQQPTVVVWPDTFTDAYRPDEGARLVTLLESLGERVSVPTEWACCGRPLYDAGMLEHARRTLRRLLDVLEPAIRLGIPVVVPEPSCLAAFTDELPGLLPDDPRAARLAGLARSPAEHLLTLSSLAGAVPPEDSRRIALHPHCHARAGQRAPHDRALLERLGYEVEVLDAGCCGLAGSFGFDARHEAISRQIGEGQWLPAVRRALGAGDRLVADGFSCRLQLEHLGGPPASTLLDMVEQALRPR